MKKFFAVFLLFCAFFAFADNKSVYIELLESNRYEDLRTHLKKWEREDKKNPDVYVGWSEYTLAVGGKTGFASESYIIDEKNPAAVVDPKTGKIVGYLNRDYFYETKIMDSVFGYLDQAILYGQDRLDLHLSKISVLAQIGEFEKEANSVIEVLNRSVKNANKWLWQGNEAIPDADRALLESLQEVYSVWLSVFNDAAAQALRKTSEAQIALYPDSLYAYNNLGLYHAFNKEYRQALELFARAEKTGKGDTILFGNIAYCNELLGNIPLAISYYEKIIAEGTTEEQALANERISNLKKE